MHKLLNLLFVFTVGSYLTCQSCNGIAWFFEDTVGLGDQIHPGNTIGVDAQRAINKDHIYLRCSMCNSRKLGDFFMLEDGEKFNYILPDGWRVNGE